MLHVHHHIPQVDGDCRATEADATVLAAYRLDVPLDAKLVHNFDHVVARDAEGIGHFGNGRQTIPRLNRQEGQGTQGVVGKSCQLHGRTCLLLQARNQDDNVELRGRRQPV